MKWIETDVQRAIETMRMFGWEWSVSSIDGAKVHASIWRGGLPQDSLDYIATDSGNLNGALLIAFEYAKQEWKS